MLFRSAVLPDTDVYGRQIVTIRHGKRLVDGEKQGMSVEQLAKVAEELESKPYVVSELQGDLERPSNTLRTEVQEAIVKVRHA